MTLTRYLYSGPQSAASLRVGDTGESLDVQLLPGKPVELPSPPPRLKNRRRNNPSCQPTICTV
jgi:hypothetical protein